MVIKLAEWRLEAMSECYHYAQNLTEWPLLVVEADTNKAEGGSATKFGIVG